MCCGSAVVILKVLHYGLKLLCPVLGLDDGRVLQCVICVPRSSLADIVEPFLAELQFVKQLD